MPPISLGSATFNIFGNSASATRALQNVSKSMLATAATAKSVGATLTVALTTPIVGFAAASVKAFKDFDNKMTQSVAIMKNVNADMRRELERTAITLSTKTIQSAADLAESYYFLTSAGYDYRDSLKLLGVTQRFATAGMLDMKYAVELLSDAQHALGLRIYNDYTKNMENMVMISDLLVKANVLANASVVQFARALTTHAGPTMKAYNIDLLDGVSMLAAYASQGIKAQRAGAMFSRMIRLTTKAYTNNLGAWRAAGIELFDQEGQWRSFIDIWADLSRYLENVTDEQIAPAMESLGFQARSSQAIMPLKGLSDAMLRFREELSQASGTTIEVANKQLQSFAAQLKIVWNNVKAVGISIGRTLRPVLERLAEQLIRVREFWGQISDEGRLTILKWAGITAVIGPTILLLQKLTGTFIALGATLTSITVGPIVAVMAGFYFLFAQISQGQLTIGDFVKETGRMIDDWATSSSQKIGGFWRNLSATWDAFGELHDRRVQGMGMLSEFKILWEGYEKGLKRASDATFRAREEMIGIWKEYNKEIRQLDAETRRDLAKKMALANKEKTIEGFRAVSDEIRKALKIDDKEGTDYFGNLKAQLETDGAYLVKKFGEVSAFIKEQFIGMFPVTEQEEEVRKLVKIWEDGVKSMNDATGERQKLLDEIEKERQAYDALGKFMIRSSDEALAHRLKNIELEVEVLTAHLEHLENIDELRAKAVAETTREIEREYALNHDNFIQGMKAGFDQQASELKTIGEMGAMIADTFTNEMTDGIWDVVDGTKAWSDALKDVARSMAEMAGKQALGNLISFGVNSFMGRPQMPIQGGLDQLGLGAFSSVNAASGIVPSRVAPGVAAYGYGATNVPLPSNYGGAAAFAPGATNVPQFQTGGVMPYTGLAQLHKDEVVFTPDQMRMLNETRPAISDDAMQRLGAPPQVILVDDRKSVEQYLTGRDGRRTIVEVSRRHRREING